MRVALLSHNAQAGDAIGNQVAEKLAFFLDRGADVRVFVEAEKRLHPAVRPHCQIVPEPQPQGVSWEFLSTADLVIVDYGQYYRLLELLPLLAAGPPPRGQSSLFRPHILFDYHGVTPAELWDGHNREALERGSRQRGLVWCADAALVHSRFTWQELGQTAFPAERFFLLEYPVDTGHFCPGSPRRHLHHVLGLPQDVSLLLFVGRVAPNKRLPVFIQALDRLRDRRPHVHAVIIGDTTDVYQIEADRCRQLAAELGLADRVHFLGQVREAQLLDAYRSADLFVMPSRHEAFCIPVIEAMACGLPVVAACAAALPETVADAGLTFAPDDDEDLARQMHRVLNAPLAEDMRRHGLVRAAKHERSLWRARFGRIVEELLDSPPRPLREELEVRPRSPGRVVCTGSESVLVPVRIINRGTHAALSEGPGRVLLRSLVADELGQPRGQSARDTPLPELLIPGQEIAAMIRVPVPAATGTYQVVLFAVPQRVQDNTASQRCGNSLVSTESSFRLIVEPAAGQSSAASLHLVQRALARAEGSQQLPIEYLDVTGGPLAKCKRWIKQKLLGNFKNAYVDVLSRQQSAFNRQTLTALQELAECCTLLNQAVGSGRVTEESTEMETPEPGLQDLREQIAEARRRLADLEGRLMRLEEAVTERASV